MGVRGYRLSDTDTRLRARGFGHRYRGFDAAAAVATVVQAIEGLGGRGMARSELPRSASPVGAALQ